MRNYDTVIFDLDGTLLDTKAGVIKSIQYTVAHLGLSPVNEHEYDLFIGPPIEQSLMYYYGLDEQQTKMAAAMFREMYSTKFLFTAISYVGVLEALAILKAEGNRLAVATYKRHDYAVKLIEYFGLNQLCDPRLGFDSALRKTKASIIKVGCLSLCPSVIL